MTGDEDVDRLKRRMTAGQLTDWLAYFEYEQETRTKQDHYAVALRHDIHQLIQLARSAFGDHSGRVPHPDDLFLTGESAENWKPPEGYEFDPDDPVRGNHEKGYGLPGIEIGQPLDEKCQKINDREKEKFSALVKMGLAQYIPPPEVKSDG